jgi:hypothetical protein
MQPPNTLTERIDRETLLGSARVYGGCSQRAFRAGLATADVLSHRLPDAAAIPKSPAVGGEWDQSGGVRSRTPG